VLEVLIRDRDARSGAFSTPWEPVRPESFFTLEAQQRGIARLREANDLVDFGIFLVAGDALVGRAQLSGISSAPFENSHLGYFGSERYNRVCDGGGAGGGRCCLRELALHRVQAAVIPRNGASIRILEKVGFREEGLALRHLQIAGVREDHALYAITAEEWPSDDAAGASSALAG
jgi:[ribosomal protein S5]-alanine N-acetyltransferase